MILQPYKIQKSNGIEIQETSCEHSDYDILAHNLVGKYAFITITKKKRRFLNFGKPFLIYDCGENGACIEIKNASNHSIAFGGENVSQSNGLFLSPGITFRLHMKGKIYATWC